jgi:hypothetical protein
MTSVVVFQSATLGWSAYPSDQWSPWAARKALGWPKKCKSPCTREWEHSYDRLKLAQLLGQLGIFLTCWGTAAVRSGTNATASPLIDLGSATLPA